LMMVFTLFLVVNTLLLSHRVANSLKVVTDAFLMPFVAYYVTRRFVKSEDRLRQLTNMLVAFGLMLIFIAIVERIGHAQLLYRLRGPFPHRNQFYMVMMVVFFMTLLSIIRSHRERNKASTLHRIGWHARRATTP